MLKSTHRVGHTASESSPLPTGWTEHRAPSGHLYYYHAETKHSTYTRPVQEKEEDLVIDYGASAPDREVQASFNVMQEFNKHNPESQHGRHFQNGSEHKDSSRPNRQGDRAKSKVAIPNCAPWVLVKTKYGRRFVHNIETKESFWKFPNDVMMAVIDMDRIEWEKKNEEKAEAAKTSADNEQPEPTPIHPRQAEHQQQTAQRPEAPAQGDFDSDEYEEVEVTDDEADGQEHPGDSTHQAATNQEENDARPKPPQEFNEDDIAWQLAQMEADEDDPGYDYADADQDLDDEGGMPLTAEDREAMFRTLLDQYNISPFSTFDALIDTNTATANAVISDDRWTALPNMSARRATFHAWSRDRVAERNDPEGVNGTTASGVSVKPKKIDPKIAYLRFLAREATPKLYWPEFKRKFRKVSEMTDRYFQDKDREKLYREYVTKLKLPEADRKKDFLALLKSMPLSEWTDRAVPEKIEKDLRFYGVREETRRQELVEVYLPP